MKVFFVLTLLLALLGSMFTMTTAQGKERACICTADYRPVCGINRVTYGNSCAASCAGVRVRHNGPCGGGQG